MFSVSRLIQYLMHEKSNVCRSVQEFQRNFIYTYTHTPVSNCNPNTKKHLRCSRRLLESTFLNIFVVCDTIVRFSFFQIDQNDYLNIRLKSILFVIGTESVRKIARGCCIQCLSSKSNCIKGPEYWPRPWNRDVRCEN